MATYVKNNKRYPLSDEDFKKFDAGRKVSFEQAMQGKREEISERFESFTSSLIGEYVTAAEQKTFTIQEAEAELWVKDNNAKVPKLRALARGRGMTLEELVPKIQKKASDYTIVFELMGKKHAYEDSLETAITTEDVDKIIVDFKV